MEQIDKYVKVKLDEFINLENCAKKYQIDIDELKEFHNLHSSYHEFVTNIHLDYTPYLYLPIAIYNNWKEKQLPVNYLSLPRISNIYKYGVTILYSPNITTINYEMSISLNHQKMILNKGKTYVNNEELDLMIEVFMEKVEQTIYPLELSLLENGMFDKILNEKEIKNRWENNIYPQLNTYYKADLSIEILEKLNRKFTAIDLYKNELRKNIFYQLFFAPIYRGYPNFTKNESCYIPVVHFD